MLDQPQTQPRDVVADPEDSPRGFAFALGAYFLWGVMPLYMKAVSHIPPTEVLAYRVLCSIPIAGLAILVLRRTADIRAALRNPRTLAMAAVTSALITTNWGIYVWAISVERTIETALGYYINPLMSVALGALILKEKLSTAQIAAVGLALVAVAILTWDAGGLPWVSLVLAATFAGYGFLRKTLPIGPTQGFFLEVMITALPALAYVTWLALRGEGHFGVVGSADTWLLLMAGPITAIPLILYAFGAKLLRYSTIGILQYVAPTMIAAIAIFVFGEPFGPARMVAFGFIWAALAVYTWSMVAQRRNAQPPTAAE